MSLIKLFGDMEANSIASQQSAADVAGFRDNLVGRYGTYALPKRTGPQIAPDFIDADTMGSKALEDITGIPMSGNARFNGVDAFERGDKKELLLRQKSKDILSRILNSENPTITYSGRGKYGRNIIDFNGQGETFSNELLKTGNFNAMHGTPIEKARASRIEKEILTNARLKAQQTNTNEDWDNYHALIENSNYKDTRNKVDSNDFEYARNTVDSGLGVAEVFAGAGMYISKNSYSIAGKFMDSMGDVLNSTGLPLGETFKKLAEVSKAAEDKVWSKEDIDGASTLVREELNDTFNTNLFSKIEADEMPSVAFAMQKFKKGSIKDGASGIIASVYGGLVNKETASLVLSAGLGLGAIALDKANEFEEAGHLSKGDSLAYGTLYAVLTKANLKASLGSIKAIGQRMGLRAATNSGIELFTENLQSLIEAHAEGKLNSWKDVKESIRYTSIETAPAAIFGGGLAANKERINNKNLNKFFEDIGVTPEEASGEVDITPERQEEISKNIKERRNPTKEEDGPIIKDSKIQTKIDEARTLETDIKDATKETTDKDIEKLSLDIINIADDIDVKDIPNVIKKLNPDDSTTDKFLTSALNNKIKEVRSEKKLTKMVKLKNFVSGKIVPEFADAINSASAYRTTKLMESFKNMEMDKAIEIFTKNGDINNDIDFVKKRDFYVSKKGKDSKAGKFAIKKTDYGWGLYNISNGEITSTYNILADTTTSTQNTNKSHIGILQNSMFKDMFKETPLSEKLGELGESFLSAKMIENKTERVLEFERLRSELFELFDVYINEDRSFKINIIPEGISAKEANSLVEAQVARMSEYEIKKHSDDAFAHKRAIKIREKRKSLKKNKEEDNYNEITDFFSSEMEKEKKQIEKEAEELFGETKTEKKQKQVSDSPINPNNIFKTATADNVSKIKKKAAKAYVKAVKDIFGSAYSKMFKDDNNKPLRGVYIDHKDATGSLPEVVEIYTMDTNGKKKFITMVKNGNKWTWGNSRTEKGGSNNISIIKGKGSNVHIFESLKDYAAVATDSKSVSSDTIIILNGSTDAQLKEAMKYIDDNNLHDGVKVYAQRDQTNANILSEIYKEYGDEGAKSNRFKNVTVFAPTNGHKKFHQQISAEGKLEMRKSRTSPEKINESVEDSETTSELDSSRKKWFSSSNENNKIKNNPKLAKKVKAALNKFTEDLMSLGMEKEHAKFLAFLVETRFSSKIDKEEFGLKYKKRNREDWYDDLIENMTQVVKDTEEAYALQDFKPTMFMRAINKFKLTKSKTASSDEAHQYLFQSALHELSHSFEETLSPVEQKIFEKLFKDADKVGIMSGNDNVSASEIFAGMFSNYIIYGDEMHTTLRDTIAKNSRGNNSNKYIKMFDKFMDFLIKSLNNLFTNMKGQKPTEAKRSVTEYIGNNKDLQAFFLALMGNDSAIEYLNSNDDTFNALDFEGSGLDLKKGYMFNKARNIEDSRMFKNKSTKVSREKRLHNFTDFMKAVVRTSIIRKIGKKITDTSAYQYIDTRIFQGETLREIKADNKILTEKMKESLEYMSTLSNNMLDKKPNLYRSAVTEKMRELLKDTTDKTKNAITRTMLHTSINSFTSEYNNIAESFEILENIENKDYLNRLLLTLESGMSPDFKETLKAHGYFRTHRRPMSGTTTLEIAPIKILMKRNGYNTSDMAIADKINKIITVYALLEQSDADKKEIARFIKDNKNSLDTVSLVTNIQNEHDASFGGILSSDYLSGYLSEESKTPKETMVIRDKQRAREIKNRVRIADWTLVSEEGTGDNYMAIFARTDLTTERTSGMSSIVGSQVKGKIIRDKDFTANAVSIYDQNGKHIGYKEVMPLDFARTATKLNENAIDVLGNMGFSLSVRSITGILNSSLLNASSADIDEIANNPKLVDDVAFALTYGEALEEELDALSDDFYKKFRKVKQGELPPEFSDVGYIRRDLDRKILGYKKAMLFGDNIRLLKLVERVFLDFVKVFKKNVLLKYPPVMMTNFISNNGAMILALGAKEFTNQTPKIIKDLKSIGGDIVSLKKSMRELVIADLKKDRKEIDRLTKEIEDNPVSDFYSEGFIQSVTDEIFREHTSETNLVEEFGENMFNKSLDFVFSKFQNDGKIRKRIEKNTKTVILSEESKLGSSIIAGIQYTDYVYRIATYKALLRAGNSEKEAKATAIDMFIDYRTNLPLVVQTISDYGIIPFAGWATRIQPILAKTLVKNPATAIPFFVGGMMSSSDFTMGVRTGSWNIYNSFLFGITDGVQNPISSAMIVPPHLEAMFDGLTGDPKELSKLLGFTLR